MGDRANPFLDPSPLPYGLPLFGLIRPEHFREAIELGIRLQRDEVEAIATDAAAPTFENTMLPLERSGAVLRRVLPVLANASSSDTNDAIEAIDTEFAPRIAAHRNAILLDRRLHARIDELHAQREQLGLDPESRYLLERRHRRALLAGANLDEPGRARLDQVTERLSALATRFQHDLLAETTDLAVHLEHEAELDGLDAGRTAAARAAAVARGIDGWLLTLVLPTDQPALASLRDERVRDRLHAASRSRGCRGGAHDTRATVIEIVRLRAERARLLGFADHAASVAADETAGTPEAIAELLGRLVPPATANARAEAEAIRRVAVRDGMREPEASDWALLADRVRAERFRMDLAAMRPYLEAGRVLHDGVFHAASLLYGLRFAERPDLVPPHPDARVFEVSEADGTPVGLYLLDLYARDSKRGGAWMSSLVEESALTGELPVVINNLNVPRPPVGQPTLLTIDEAETLFHEFGHALHGLLARVAYPSFAGTNVHRDFVELPSQVNELWLFRPEVLQRFAVHHGTGERMPQHLVDGLLAARGWGEGFATTEYLAAAVVDQAWHRLPPGDEVTDVAAFEHAALAAAGLDDPLIPPRYSSTYFAHVFAGGYDAGYYAYVWSEVPGADIMEWFEEHGGATRENGDRFRAEILAPGGSRDPAESIRALLGREPTIEALLRRRNLA